jgi:hypothetical protein
VWVLILVTYADSVGLFFCALPLRYLFAGIRPEMKYQSFTGTTLNFAENASIVKLKPKTMDR